jgi:alpha-tubulin suppressor-like RCC1 family protein
MRSRSGSAACFSWFLPGAVTLLVIACDEATAPRVPTKLAFTVQPAPGTVGQTTLSAVKVAVQDATGATVTTATNDITVAIGTNPASGTLAGTVTVAAVNGVATFSDLSIDNTGVGYTLSATSLNLTGATSTPFAVVAGLPAKLVFTLQPPASAIPGAPFSVSVTIQDQLGNRVTNATCSITVAIGTNPGPGALFGITSVSTVNGIATFSNLSINTEGVGYTLSATSPGLTSATSSPFTVQVGPASKLVFTVQPAPAPPGATITPAVAVTIQDVGGNRVTTATNSITVAIGTNLASGTLSGTTTVPAVNGVATFSNLSINIEGAGYTLTATAANLSGGTSAPFRIGYPLVFATVTAGYFHSCGLATGGVAYCWGDNFSGQLGEPALTGSTAPIPVSGGLTFAKIGAGRDHTCGVTPSGVAYCWGSNFSGELGTGGSAQSGVPAAVSGGLTFADATAGYAHTCGVTTGGVGYCWGDNTFGELGNSTVTQRTVPTAVSGGLTFASISQGRFFSCGMTTAGAAYCWGTNASGELGDGTTSQRPSPTLVSGQLTFAMISAGGFHACGLTTGGLAYCWGSGGGGQLGNGTGTPLSFTPVPVSGGLTFATLSAGNRHTCGVTTGGVAYCWGDNSSGNLGNDSATNSLIPVAVAGGLTFATVSAGRFHTCGVTTGGAAYCWGGLALGNGTTTGSLVPVPVR